jgi:hypothetical protein
MSCVVLLGLAIATSVDLLGQMPENSATAAPSSRDHLEVPAGTSIPVVLVHTLTSKTARVGDFVTFKTLAPTHSESRELAIPAESMIRGTVIGVKRPGRVKGKSQLRIHLERVSLPNGFTMELSASLEPPGPEHPADKEGGTIEGEGSKAHDVIIMAEYGGQGAIVGGLASNSGKDAAVGAGAGVLVGLIGVLLSRGPEIRLEPGTPFRITLSRPLRVDLNELRAMPEVLQPILPRQDHVPRLKRSPETTSSPQKP